MNRAGEKLSFVIPAAGRGLRLGLGPKALLELDGKPLLRWLADKALRLADEVIIASPPELTEQFAELCPGCRCIPGGATRQESIARLARASRHEWVLLHDAARPFVSAALIAKVVEAARSTGYSGAFLDPDVPVARLRDGMVTESFAHDQVGIFQAPQAFARHRLLDLVQMAEAQSWQEQSTVQLALRAGFPVSAVPGEKTNIKLTSPEDWTMAIHLAALLR